MSLKAKIEAVIYASEEPVTLQQLVSLLGQQAQAEIDAADALQGRQLALLEAESPLLLLQETEPDDEDALNAETLGTEEFAAVEAAPDESVSEGAEPPAVESDSTEIAEAEIAVTPAEPSPEPPPPQEPSEPSAAQIRARERRLRDYLRSVLEQLIEDYARGDRGLEIREVAGGFRFATKPEYHDAVRGFVRSLKPPLKLSLQALETLAVVAYKQPVTAPEISEVRGVDSGGVLGSLMTRKLITTAGRKQVIGRPILYKTTKEFLLRFGLKDLSELPSIEEFERLALDLNEAVQEDMPMPREPVVPIANVTEMEPLSPAEVAREVEPSREQHMAQADGDPNDSGHSPDETSAGHLTPAPDAPSEFTGDESIPPADNILAGGRGPALPPHYDRPGDESMDSPAHDAEVQAEVGEDH